MPSNVTRVDLERALPDVTSTFRLAGLEKPVTVFRDSWGIPHIRASGERDAFFAQGFATAQDRLWHMDYDRRRATGRWAEFAGPDALPGDRLFRRMSLERAARADYRASSPEARAMLDAYTSGVNAFIETASSLPIEYSILDATPEPWEAWQCLAAYKIRNTPMGTFEMKLWRARVAKALGAERAAKLFRGYQAGHLVTVPPGELYDGAPENALEELAEVARLLSIPGDALAGSNAWVISGERSATGLPLVAGDSHRPLDTPNVYYQVHITCPEFSVSGYSIPGVPGAPHFSHTQFVAFGMTHGMADYQDLFIERFRNEGGRLECEYQGRWEPADEAEETIRIRGAEPEALTVVTTRHGPIIAGDPAQGQGLAFCATGTNTGRPWPDAIRAILLARSADELEEAVRDWNEPVNNYMYGDVRGEFGYRLRGLIPVRHTSNHWGPVPGWTGEHEWQGMIPWEEMPQVRNPERGFAVTGNQRVAPADFPHYIGLDYNPGYRARRIADRLMAMPEGTAGVDDMASVHAERTSIPAKVMIEAMRGITPGSQRPREARDLLLAWDGKMDRESPAAAVYAATRFHWLREVIDEALGPLADEAFLEKGRGGPTHCIQLYSRAVTAMGQGDDSVLPEGRTWPDVLEDALARAVEDLTERLGPDMAEWQWGKVHRTHPVHPLSASFPDLADLLDPPGVPASGDGETPQQGGYSHEDRFTVTAVSVNRYIHDPSDWRRSRWIVPLGASGHPASPHYADQAEMWAAVEYVPQLWDWDEIATEAETRQELLPGG